MKGDRGGENKSTMAEVQQRIDVVYQMLLQGLGKQEIVRYCADKWKVGVRTTEKYIHRATIELGHVSNEERQSALGSAVKRLNSIYYKAMKKDDLKTAIVAQKEINDLFHLKDEEHKTDNVINITFSNGEEKLL